MSATPGRCPSCGARQRPDPASTPRVAILVCEGCLHRIAVHERGSDGGDYHAQYDQDGFLAALRATRVRQARAILALLRSHDPGAHALLDFGCGRGWFLAEAALRGFDRVAGADSSEMAVQLQARAGFEALRVSLENPGELDARALTFRPQVLSLLDVVEHFPAERARPILSSLLQRLGPELRWVVVKVPVSSGFLYRTAAQLSRAGAHGLLEQLYQVGTAPPHLVYFSRRSLRSLLEQVGLEIVALQPDRDFEPGAFADRVALLRRAPPWVGRVAGSSLAALIDVAGWQDSVVALARPASAA